MSSHARQAPSFAFEYDNYATWTENCRRRAYVIQASPSSDDGDPVAKWERQCAAETVKYFETEHDEVVADAERRAAADPRSTRPFGGGEAYDRTMAREALGLHDLADQQLWGAEAIAAFLPIAKAARGGKDDDPSLDNHIDCLARTFVWRFIKAKKSNTTMEPLDNVVPTRPDKPSRKPVKPTSLDDVSLGRGFDWTETDGLLGDLTSWILETSYRPNRPLAVAAAVGVLSAVCGRRLFTPTGLSLAAYISCLAKTGVGKQAVLDAVPRILHAAGLGGLHRTAKAFSVSAFENIITESPVCIATADEFAATVLTRILNKRASSHEAQMKSFLLDVYNRGIDSPPYQLIGRARSIAIPKDNEILTAIALPSFTMFGVSTPDEFYEALTGGNVKDGFMNRFLIADADPKGKSNDLEGEIPVPQGVIDDLREVATFGDGDLAPSPGHNQPMVMMHTRRRVGWTDDAREEFYAFRDEIEALADTTLVAPELLARIPEQTLKLATIRAVSWLGPEHATLDHWDLSWGAAWAIESAKSMIESASTMMAANPYEKNLNRIRAYLGNKGKPAGKKGGFVSRSELLREFRDIPARDLDDLTRRMVDSGEIEPAEKETSGRKAKGFRQKG
jgi:hypothetical protein